MRELNDGVSNIDGEGEDYTGLGTRLVHTANKQLVQRGLIADTCYPARSTMDLHNLKASYYDKDVSMIKESTLMHKTVWIHIAARSVRNCMSQICAVAYSHCVPSMDRYEHKPGIMKDSTELINLVQKVTGTFVRPVKKENIMNTDMTSMYYYAGVAYDDRKGHRWARVGK